MSLGCHRFVRLRTMSMLVPGGRAARSRSAPRPRHLVQPLRLLTLACQLRLLVPPKPPLFRLNRPCPRARHNRAFIGWRSKQELSVQDPLLATGGYGPAGEFLRAQPAAVHTRGDFSLDPPGATGVVTGFRSQIRLARPEQPKAPHSWTLLERQRLIRPCGGNYERRDPIRTWRLEDDCLKYRVASAMVQLVRRGVVPISARSSICRTRKSATSARLIAPNRQSFDAVKTL